MSHLSELERITAFVDEELDLSDRLDMERRYETEPAVRGQVDELRELRTAVKRATYHVAPQDLNLRLASQFRRAQPPVETMRRPIRQALDQWFHWRALAAALSIAGVATVLVHRTWIERTDDQRLLDDVVASHVRSTLGQHLVDVASADHHQVKPFLSSRLGFSPPVSELQVPGSEFVGGRVDYLDDRPVAALVYRQGPHVVNSFIWPAGGADRTPSFAQEKGFRTAHWTSGGMTHWVISDVNAQEFQAVVQALRRSDEQR